jgi:hypothetical protein
MIPLDSKGINGFNENIKSGEGVKVNILLCLQSIVAAAVLYGIIYVLMATLPFLVEAFSSLMAVLH